MKPAPFHNFGWGQKKQTENAVEKYLRLEVKKLRGSCPKLQLLTGWPDRLVLLPGARLFFVETKRPKGGKMEPLQPQVHAMLRSLGFRVYVCKTKEEVDVALILR